MIHDDRVRAAIVGESAAEIVLERMRRHPRGAEASIIGLVTETHPKMVVMATGVGGTRVVDLHPRRDLAEDLLTSRGKEHMDRVAIWIPLAVGGGALAVTIVIHTLVVAGTITLARHAVRVRGAGAGFWSDVAIVAGAVGFALGAHLLEIGVWAGLLMACGEFSAFAMAYYHSAVNFTTLGYGDVIMSESWRLLGPLEAANGMLLFGVSTALIFAVIQRIAQDKFPDLKA